MEWRVALVSLGSCIAINFMDTFYCKTEVVEGKRYRDTVENVVEEGIIFGKRFEDFGIRGDIDEYGESRCCNWL